jgi:hypothetical protein
MIDILLLCTIQAAMGTVAGPLRCTSPHAATRSAAAAPAPVAPGLHHSIGTWWQQAGGSPAQGWQSVAAVRSARHRRSLM